jgi:iron(III) transport system substrate-binding protein
MRYYHIFLAVGGICAVALLIVSSGFLWGGPWGDREVVVYTSVDQIYAEPILKEYQERTGVRVRAVYDVEATKTTGLVNRLIAEKDNPIADVFWNGEFVQTILLKEKGVLAPYVSPEGAAIPDTYRDPEGYWAGVGGRARIFLVNTDRLSPDRYPQSLFDLAHGDIPGEEIAIAYPIFGTSATHAAALYAAIGDEATKSFYQELKDRNVRVVDGNSVVRDLVASGQISVGLTDTDDACGAVERGAPVAIVIPDQEAGGMGTLIVPTTAALIAGSPNPDEGRLLIDYLLSEETEQNLMDIGWIQTSPRLNMSSSACIGTNGFRGMDIAPDAVYAELQKAKQDLTEVFVR